ncbi:MAG TPA: T9SS type A sorting domain-containing protein [Flavitalea sp.]|nr:T9SS type A sorting domain-containing protein [Flavitalea sp.]
MKKLVLTGIILTVAWICIQSLVNIHVPEFEIGDDEEEERESGADKQMASWWWSRGYPDPENINEKYYQGWLQALAMKNPELKSQRNDASISNTSNTVSVFSGNWTAIGPNQSIGGRVLCVAVDPRNSNNVLIGTASGGIWKSKTGGVGTAAWTPVTTGFPLLGVASIIIHPRNSNIIYAGTGEVYRVDTSNIGFNVWKARGTYGMGVLKSTDGGNSWQRVYNRNISNLFGVQMLKFDPVNPDIVYACTTEGLYRTMDAGSTWSKILDKIYVSDIAIHPTNTNLLLAAVGNLTNSDKGIYRSTNGGVTWTKISSGLPASFEGFTRLDNVTTSQNLVIASIGRDAGTQNELYRSADFGNTWSVLPASNHCKYQFWFSHDVAINPSNTLVVLMAGVPLMRYNLSNSTSATIGGVHSDIHDIEFDPSNSGIVYVACDGGMYKSVNGGASFSAINGGLQAVQFYASFAVSPTNPSIMLGGLQDNGVVRYNGTSWTSVAGGDGGSCVFHPTNSNIAFASNDARRLLRSTDAGRTFSEVLSSWAFQADSRTGFMAPVAISKSNPSVLYVASDNLHKSTSTGTSGSWPGNTYASATNFIEARHKTGVAIGVSPVNADKLYISTSPFAQYDNDVSNLYINTPPNLFKSINGGVSFINIKSGLPDRFVMDFAISATNDDSVWIVLGGYGTSHVFVSADGGATWTSKGTGLPDVPHNAVLVDPKNPRTIYVGNDLGIYVSPDAGTTWYDFNNGLWDATLVMDLVATSNNKMVAATHGKGAFITDLYASRLPLTLVSFTGTTQDAYNNLQWVTSAEINVLEFEVERSVDGGGFIKIGSVSATNSPTGSVYTFQDPIAGIGFAENVFYRLKMVDIDGQYSYSNVVNLRMSFKSNIVVTNPFHQNITITYTTRTTKLLDIDLFDAGGHWLMRKIYTVHAGANAIAINNLDYLPPGSYIVSIQSGKEKFTRKLLKK